MISLCFIKFIKNHIKSHKLGIHDLSDSCLKMFKEMKFDFALSVYKVVNFFKTFKLKFITFKFSFKHQKFANILKQNKVLK